MQRGQRDVCLDRIGLRRGLLVDPRVKHVCLTHHGLVTCCHAGRRTPQFTFQASCLNGKPETNNNLGYSLLKNGCIATVSASRNSWYEIGQTSFAGSATNSGMAFEYASRLIDEEMYAGDALNDLKWGVLLPSPSEEDRENEVLWMNSVSYTHLTLPTKRIV